MEGVHALVEVNEQQVLRQCRLVGVVFGLSEPMQGIGAQANFLMEGQGRAALPEPSVRLFEETAAVGFDLKKDTRFSQGSREP